MTVNSITTYGRLAVLQPLQEFNGGTGYSITNFKVVASLKI